MAEPLARSPGTRPRGGRRRRRARVGQPLTTAGQLAGAVGGALGLALVLAGCAPGPVAPLPPPPATLTTLPTTTAPPDLSGVSLGTIPGQTTTTTVGLGPGSARLFGAVVGPGGSAVPGATVELQRLVGDSSGGAAVVSRADGTWSAQGILGGRYLVRAWRPPDLVMTKADVLFLADGTTRSVDLGLDSVGGPHLGISVAPDPPVVGQPAQLIVQVTDPTVAGDGSVSYADVPGVSLGLSPVGLWTIGPPNPRSTDGSGTATWLVMCDAAGQQPMSVLINGGQAADLGLSDCAPPAPPPTTTSPFGGPGPFSSTTTITSPGRRGGPGATSTTSSTTPSTSAPGSSAPGASAPPGP